MNRFSFIAAATAALALSSSAFAFSEADFAPVPVSTMTRAQVKAGITKADMQAQNTEYGVAPVAVATTPSNVTRAAVRAETRTYVKSGNAERFSELSVGG